MALDQNAQYPIGTLAPTADYPEGSAINETVLDALDGYPWEKENINDKLGFQQALLRVTGQSASGNADTALVSQYLQGMIELASGRAFTYDDSGVADAYVLDVQTNQQAPASLFDGQILKFVPNFDNGGACTADPFGVGATDIKRIGGIDDPIAGQLVAGEETTLVYRTSPGVHLELVIDDPHLIDEVIVSGGAVTQIDFTGLDINAHKGYRIIIEHNNATGIDYGINMTVNGDTTLTNYYSQTAQADGGVAAQARLNNANIASADASDTSKADVSLSLSNSYPMAISLEARNIGSSVVIRSTVYSKTATVANITSLSFISDVVNSLGNGTRIRIYREDI